MEDFDDYIFLILKMLYFEDDKNVVKAEQVGLILGSNFVISFEEGAGAGDVFNPVRERIRNGKGRIRKLGPDYPAYALVDVIVEWLFSDP